MSENSHQGHRSRLKDRFHLEGLDHFKEHEALELLLTFAIPQRDVNPLAHELIDHFGSLQAVLSAGWDELTDVKGIGDHAAALITLVQKINRFAFISDEHQPIVFRQASFSRKFFMEYLRDEPYECFALATLRSDLSLIRVQKMSRGSLVEAPVFVRGIVEMAFRQHAYAVLLAHNHPSGSSQPSQADIETTQRINEALLAMDICLCDHIIVGARDTFSLFHNAKIKMEPQQLHRIANCGYSPE